MNLERHIPTLMITGIVYIFLKIKRGTNYRRYEQSERQSMESSKEVPISSPMSPMRRKKKNCRIQ